MSPISQRMVEARTVEIPGIERIGESKVSRYSFISSSTSLISEVIDSIRWIEVRNWNTKEAQWEPMDFLASSLRVKGGLFLEHEVKTLKRLSIRALTIWEVDEYFLRIEYEHLERMPIKEAYSGKEHLNNLQHQLSV